MGYGADSLPFRSQAAAAASGGDQPGDIGPFKGDNGQGGAPGGKSLGDSLPVRDVSPGSGFTTNGVSYGNEQPPLPECGRGNDRY